MHADSRQWRFFVAQLTLRLLAAAFSLAAIVVLASSSQSATVYGIIFEVRYSYSSAFRFKLGADAVVFAFSSLSLVVIYLLYRKNSDSASYFYVLLSDMVLSVMAISGCAAATAVGFIGRYGLSQTGWLQVCDRVNKFCEKLTLSIALSYVAFICFFSLSIMAAYKLRSRHKLSASVETGT